MMISAIQRSVAATALALSFTACGPENEFVAPPPPPVTVASPEVCDVTVYRTFPGTLEGIASVEVRARLRGVLEKIHFADGVLVKKDQPLYLIEQAPFKAALQAAEANLAKAEANLQLKTATRGRIERAARTDAVSDVDVEVAKAEEAGAAASVKEAEASVEDARINLSYTEIVAPVAGHVSRSLVDEGNLVDGSQATLLTTIVDDTSIRAYFELNERVILPYLELRPRPGANEELRVKENLELQLELTDGTVYDQPGKLDFLDNRVDQATRTMRVRAVFPNPEGKLAVGLFARVGIPFKAEQAVLVPSLAILRDLGGDYVWIVDDNNIVRRQGVEIGAAVGEQRIIEKGLDGSHRVIVAGLQRAREGAEVSPEIAEAAPPGDSGKPATGNAEGDSKPETGE